GQRWSLGLQYGVIFTFQGPGFDPVSAPRIVKFWTVVQFCPSRSLSAHCVDKGHVFDNCPRNDSANKVRVFEKTTLKPRKDTQKGTKEGNKVAPGAPKKTRGGVSTGIAGGSHASDDQQEAVQGDADNQNTNSEQAGALDDPMDALEQQQDNETATGQEADDTNMGEASTSSGGNRAAPLEKQMKKIGKVDGAEDFSTAKQLAAASEAANGPQNGWTSPPSPRQL
ncbi:hypothetical protein MBANPS3_008402, partial [Mucor bainieri]